METVTVQIEIPTELYQRLQEVAAQRQISIDELVTLILTEWLEREARLQEGRDLMLKVGEGLGEGQPPHDAAANHDVYLYGKPRTENMKTSAD